MFKAPKATHAFANPALVRELERAASDAAMKAQTTGALVLQGRATQEDKDAAFAAAKDAEAALKAEQSNIVSV